MKEEKAYDFIIVGSGIGGLTCALLLARHNFSVLVLEKNKQIGGALQVFSRDKRIFDTGVHYIGGLNQGENLNLLFNYLGIYNELKLTPLGNDCYDLIRLADGTSCVHAQGYSNFIDQLSKTFPGERQVIVEFCETIREICGYFPLYNLSEETDHSYIKNPEILEIGAWKYVSGLTDNEQLKLALIGSGLLYAGEKETTPLYVVALIMNSYINGSYRLEDGGSQIAKAFVRELRKFGGKILTRKEVTHATMNLSGEVDQIFCSDGTVYSGKNFISNTHPSSTIRIFGQDNFRKAYRERISNCKNTVSCFMVYLSLKEDSFPYFDYNIYDYFTNDGWQTTTYHLENWPQVMFICPSASSKSPNHATALSVMCYMNYEEVEQWSAVKNTVENPKKRNNGYEDFKKAKEGLVLNRLEERFPGIREKIINVYSSTPLTYRDYLDAPEGSLYGIKKDYRNTLLTNVQSRTKIPNLFMTGQNIVFHGILGSTIAGFVTSFNFLDYSSIIKEISKLK